MTAAPCRLEVVELGVVDYEAASRMQEARVEARHRGAPDALLLVEHPPVYTVGRAGDARHLGTAAVSGIPIVRSARGGEATYHGPGQLVVYPIVDLGPQGRDVRAYVMRLESAILRVLANWRIAGRREPGRPGIWVGSRKIASIGIAIRRWVAWHGLALNVGPDVAPFARIAPCGIAGLQMTSMALEGGPATTAEVRPVLVAALAAELGHEMVVPFVAPGAPEARP
jgi:lipoyl(octanoyl) transferase